MKEQQPYRFVTNNCQKYNDWTLWWLLPIKSVAQNSSLNILGAPHAFIRIQVQHQSQQRGCNPTYVWIQVHKNQKKGKNYGRIAVTVSQKKKNIVGQQVVHSGKICSDKGKTLKGLCDYLEKFYQRNANRDYDLLDNNCFKLIAVIYMYCGFQYQGILKDRNKEIAKTIVFANLVKKTYKNSEKNYFHQYMIQIMRRPFSLKYALLPILLPLAIGEMIWGWIKNIWIFFFGQ